ncbi:MAG: amino acid permease [Moorellaceae bacterium]
MNSRSRRGELDDQQILRSFDYQQELKRTLKFFSSFAVAFSFISITTGIFTNYGFVMSTAGPAGIWSWPIVSIGHFLVAVVFAELAGHMPLTGYSYQWVSRLANPAWGWFVGWMSFCFLFLVIPAVDGGMAPVLAQLLGIEGTSENLKYIVIATLILQAVLNIVGVSLASLINNAAVFTETIGIIGLTLCLGFVALRNDHSPAILFHTGKVTGSYLGPFLLSALMGSFTLVGFEAAANLSEETVKAHQTVPRAITSSVALSGIFGTLFLVASTWAIKDVEAVLSSDVPLPYIIESSLGMVLGKMFLVLVVISIFACGLVIMTSGSRLIYALARDNVFVFNGVFRKVLPHSGVPAAGILLLLVFGILATIYADSLTLLVGATSVLPALIYLSTVVAYGLYRRKLSFAPDTFNLGKYGGTITSLAIAWLIIEIGILTIPQEFHQVTLVTGVLLLVGAILYWTLIRKQMAVEKYKKTTYTIET